MYYKKNNILIEVQNIVSENWKFNIGTAQKQGFSWLCYTVLEIILYLHHLNVFLLFSGQK